MTGNQPTARALWREQPPPPLPSGVAAVGNWGLLTPADLTASRAQLRGTLLQEPLPVGADGEDIERLLLAFEELASNGLRHGRPPVRVRVTPTGDGWLIDVTDAATEVPPAPAVDRDPSHGGLGLYLVARLCTAHGWIVHRDRKHVWAWVRPVPP